MGCAQSRVAGAEAVFPAVVPVAPTGENNRPNEDTKTPNRPSDDSSPGKILRHSSSLLEEVIEARNEEGDLTAKVVHIELPGGKPIEDVYDGVHDGEILGSGVSGLVRRVTHRSTGIQYAVKCLNVAPIETEEQLQQLREEIYIMCQLDHPNIVRLEEVYESSDVIYLVQELCTGRELFDRLGEQTDDRYTERQCAQLVAQMLSAVRFLHSKGVVHRDLKLENFLFQDSSPVAELRMIDFGLSKHFTAGRAERKLVGTPYTVAPEVIRGCYDERCDLWAVGVMAFILLSGDTPFGGCNGSEDDLREIGDNILRGDYSFEPSDRWDSVSDRAKDFIRSLLVLDPTKRLTAEEAQKSPWLREWAGRDGDGEGRELNSQVFEALAEFKGYTDTQKLLCEVLSFTLLPDQIECLRREFKKLDLDGLGEISLSDFKLAVSHCEVAKRRSSFRAPTDEEIEGVFHAMRQHRAEARVHWHEFVAAGLGQCDVDERNFKLAFDRLDADHKGYISFDDILDLRGNEVSGAGKDAMRRQWGDLTRLCRSPGSRVTYEDFLLLMNEPVQMNDADHPRIVLPAAA